MKDLLKNINGFIFENENSFEPNTLPCYFYKKDDGYVVYFELKGEGFDLGIYNNQKLLICLITKIDQSIHDNWKEQFINRSIHKTELSKLKMYESKV